jgi:hypothetical protein
MMQKKELRMTPQLKKLLENKRLEAQFGAKNIQRINNRFNRNLCLLVSFKNYFLFSFSVIFFINFLLGLSIILNNYINLFDMNLKSISLLILETNTMFVPLFLVFYLLYNFVNDIFSENKINQGELMGKMIGILAIFSFQEQIVQPIKSLIFNFI